MIWHISGALGLVHMIVVCYCFGLRDVMATDSSGGAGKTSLVGRNQSSYSVPWLTIFSKAPFWLAFLLYTL